uniref:Uncharacterized protein n=1 Tax=Erpetoichthys calabaricus TaxID=27687 RepID=A0A8C4RWB9_ERPCA
MSTVHELSPVSSITPKPHWLSSSMTVNQPKSNMAWEGSCPVAETVSSGHLPAKSRLRKMTDDLFVYPMTDGLFGYVIISARVPQKRMDWNPINRRVPEIIHVAKCQHQGCIGQNGKEDLTFYSLPIKRKMIFLHKVKKGFKLKMKTVSVGCTCVRPRIQN